MSNEKREIRINPTENSKRVMYLIKEYLLTHDDVELVSGTAGAPVAVRSAETLARLGYVDYESIKTDTILVDDRRKTKFSIKLKKSDNFQALYDENEEIRRRTQEINEII